MMSPATAAKIAVLADRGVVGVTGEDAEKLLQGIISNDMDLLADRPAIHAALLTPQGKILFDFFVVKVSDGFLLEAAVDKVADLAKRLSLYRLRAKVEIRERTQRYRILALWGGPHEPPLRPGVTLFPDPRLPALGLRALAEIPTASEHAWASQGEPEQEYHRHRIALGVPEGGKDYAFGETFPHEADLDQLDGVSFTKGCFVGQEVVSRMQNRANVRKRILPVVGEAPLRAGAEITAGAALIGAVGSVADKDALALVRLDRAAEAAAKGDRLLAGGVAIALRKPDWARFELRPTIAAGAS
jgi:folate-binding protein YgfZ